MMGSFLASVGRQIFWHCAKQGVKYILAPLVGAAYAKITGYFVADSNIIQSIFKWFYEKDNFTAAGSLVYDNADTIVKIVKLMYDLYTGQKSKQKQAITDNSSSGGEALSNDKLVISLYKSKYGSKAYNKKELEDALNKINIPNAKITKVNGVPTIEIKDKKQPIALRAC